MVGNDVRVDNGYSLVEAVVGHDEGFNMRNSMYLVDICTQHEGDVFVRVNKPAYQDEPIKVDGKSIMQITMLAATKGTMLEVGVEGTDDLARNKASEIYSFIAAEG